MVGVQSVSEGKSQTWEGGWRSIMAGLYASLGKIDSTPQTMEAPKWLYEEEKEDQICICKKITH